MSTYAIIKTGGKQVKANRYFAVGKLALQKSRRHNRHNSLSKDDRYLKLAVNKVGAPLLEKPFDRVA